jgi:hypothetical protein
MNKFAVLASLIILSAVFLSCKKSEESYTFSGKAQKGPFIAGANITINELNENFEQTGKSFSSSTASDDGSFSLNSVELATPYALITVNGFYFDEVSGTVTQSALNLQAIADLSGKNTVNVNALTHVIRTRIEKLIADGNSFEQANQTAKTELLSLFFDVTNLETDFDQLDITQSSEANAALLAFSVMMAGSSANTAVLVELLTKIRTDFGENGTVNNAALLQQVKINTALLTPFIIRHNMATKYAGLGISASIPNFEKYINKFVEKFAEIIYTDYHYPEYSQIASAMFEFNNPEHLNLLHKSTTNYSGSMFSFAAITPFEKSLKIRLTSTGTFFNISMHDFFITSSGWKIEDIQQNEITLSAQRQNLLCSFSSGDNFRVTPADENGFLLPLTIEYFENGSPTPSFTKTITFTP